MKKSNWMSNEGHQSGVRAERLAQDRLRARSPMEVFADEFVLVAVLITILVGLLGAVMLGDTIPQEIGSEMDPIMLWLGNRLAGFLVGLLGAFLLIDVPLTIAVTWLKKNRPALFQRRG